MRRGVLLDERVTELENAEQLSRAEEWQRAQAWATWEKIKEGDRRDVPMERFDEHTDEALARLDRPAKASYPCELSSGTPTSKRTTWRSSGGWCRRGLVRRSSSSPRVFTKKRPSPERVSRRSRKLR